MDISASMRVGLLILGGCVGGDATDPIDTDVGELCGALDEPWLEFAQEVGAYGELTDGDDVHYGHPPQGGAPYAPFRLRVRGLFTGEPASLVTVSGADPGSGEEMGAVEVRQMFICSNTGDNLNYHVSAEVHMRFFGLSLDELEDRPIDLTLRVEDMDGAAVEAEVSGVLRWSL